MDQQNDPNPFAGSAASGAEGPATSGKAVASLVLGISGFLCWVITALPAIILGIIALRDIGRSGGRLQGNGLAIGGITTGAVSLLCCGLMMPALLLPAVQAAREAARRNQSLNNIKQINLGLLNYESEQRSLPVIGTDAAGNKPNLSWRVHLLPYIEGGSALYEQFHLDEPWDSEHNLSLLDQMPSCYMNPSLPLGNKTTYLAVVGPGAAFRGEDPGPRFADFTDGIDTIWIVEADEEEAVEWTKPDDWEFDPNDPTRGLGKLRRGQVLVGRIDGSAGALDTNFLGPGTLNREMTRDAGD